MTVITQQELGRRLRLARLNVGLSQEEVATELRLVRPTISQMESGKRGVGSIELAKLARLYGRPLAWFFEDETGEAVTEDPLTLLFRATQLRPEDKRVVTEFEALCRAYGDLETLLGLRNESAPPDYSSIGEPRDKLDAIRQGERVALDERRRLGIGDDPIRDLFELLDSQAVHVFVRPLQESGISGLFLYDRSTGPCILINGSEHPRRRPFNLAHEYAHVLLDRKLRAHASATSRLLGEADERGELLEVRANRFAADFLMPAAGITRFLGDRGRSRHDRGKLDIVDVLYLQRAFGVSYQAMLYRLQNLRWLDRARREQLAQHQPEVLARTLGLSEERLIGEVEPSDRRFPARYVYLALEAYRQGEISLGKLAELLGKDVGEARELVWALEEDPSSPVPEAR
jgi:Zn-dependent peptidase ImmA (M78 family)/DNA-binding XRE family transcriptional regulator